MAGNVSPVMKSGIDLILILDASGSMRNLIGDTVGGVNAFFDDQRAQPGEARVSLTTFDTEVRTRYADVPLREVPDLTREQYFGGHGRRTALFDAVGLVLTRYEAVPEKGEKTLVLITTDGHENASREWKLAPLRQLIASCQARGWAFVFLGTDDSVWQGAELGASAGGRFRASPEGTASLYRRISEQTSRIRGDERSAHVSAGDETWDEPDGAPAPQPPPPSSWAKPGDGA